MLRGRNLHYEGSDRVRGLGAGGIGAMHLLAQRTGLTAAIDEGLELLKVHQPYHESDHVLNIAYKILCGGKTLEDLEQRRQDEVYLDAGGEGDPRSDHGGRLLPALHRSRRRGAAGGDRSSADEGVATAAGGVLRGGDHRGGRDAGGDDRRVQGRDGDLLRRALGLSPAGGNAGKHRRAVVAGEPEWQPAVARRGGGAVRPGDRAVSGSGVP